MANTHEFDTLMSNLKISWILIAKLIFVSPLLVTIFYGCINIEDNESLTSANNTSTPVPTSTPISVESILDQSATIMSELDSFSFSLEHKGGVGTKLDDLLLVTAEGKIESPNSLDIEVNLLLGTLPFQTRIISKGQISYIQNPLNDKWEKMEQSLNPLAYFDPETGIKSLLSGISDSSMGTESTKTQYEIRGTISANSLDSFVGITVDDQVSLKLLINKSSNYLDVVHIYGRIQPSDVSEIVRKLTIYEHNEPAYIKLPGLD